MATPIPLVVSQMFFDSDTQDIIVAGNGVTGTPATVSVATSRYYFYVSNVSTAANGQSFLQAMQDLFDAAESGAVTWTVQLDTNRKLTFAQDSGSFDRTLTFDGGMGKLLGFTSDGPHTVPQGATLTADYRSRFLWSPDQSISETGPELFDPSISYGVPQSAGTSQWSPDMTGAYTSNGTQFMASYTFNGVQFYYKARHDTVTYEDQNESWEEFWTQNIRKGRRVLMWRDRTDAISSPNPTEGSGSPYNYVEYQPTDDMRRAMMINPVTPDRLTHWDVTWDFLVTENGETPYTD